MFRAFVYPLATGNVTDNVYAVRLGIVDMFLYTDAVHAIAIDAGSSEDALRTELERSAIDPNSVTHLFLTHSDFDHAGGQGLFENAEVYLSVDEEQMIDGTTARWRWFYRNRRIDRLYHVLGDGDVVTVGPIRVQAIATLGHTPGSMSFLVNDAALFTGDTLPLRDGQVRPFYRLFSMDPVTQRESIRKLANLQGITLLCTAHTGCTTDYARAMSKWRKAHYLPFSLRLRARRYHQPLRYPLAHDVVRT